MCTEDLSNETTSVYKQNFPGFPFSTHTHELNLQVETNPRSVPISYSDNNT